jgi:hypothetical protein
MSEWIKAAWDNGSYDGKVGTPEQAAKISKAIKASWSNLEVRQKRIEGIKASDINPPEGHARRVEYARTRKRDSKGRFPKG